jgi:hypothetical protein
MNKSIKTPAKSAMTISGQSHVGGIGGCAPAVILIAVTPFGRAHA